METLKPDTKPILSVTEISLSLKACVEQVFSDIRVRGEVSGVKKAASGHIYFSLKDQDSVLSAVAWRGRDKTTQNAITEGLEIICTGKLSTYPGRSNYQMIVETAEPAGAGALLKLLNERHEKLQKEGLFDAARKKKIPYLPEVIGVVTSPTGAVIRDIMHRLTDRFGRQVILWPVLVQGDMAADQITAAIKGFNAIPPQGLDVPYACSRSYQLTETDLEIELLNSDEKGTNEILTENNERQFNIALLQTDKVFADKTGFIHLPRPDLLIVARGGGSLEDLWPFNEENVVRAAAASDIPLISAVGHETDTTLIDYASDLRAPTPTAAAELAVPVKFELASKISNIESRLNDGVFRYLSEKQLKIENLSKSIPNLGDLINLFIQKLDDRSERLQISIKNYIKNKENQFVNLKNLLKSYSFQAVLERGFSLVTDNGGKIIASARVAKDLPMMKISFFDGKVNVQPCDVKTPASSNVLSETQKSHDPTAAVQTESVENKNPIYDPSDKSAANTCQPCLKQTSGKSKSRQKKTKLPDPNQRGLFDDL